jgi:hypothetical protein
MKGRGEGNVREKDPGRRERKEGKKGWNEK